jgi:hypothetical protein
MSRLRSWVQLSGSVDVAGCTTCGDMFSSSLCEHFNYHGLSLLADVVSDCLGVVSWQYFVKQFINIMTEGIIKISYPVRSKKNNGILKIMLDFCL